MQAYLWGHTRVGENVEDEWVITYLLHTATAHASLASYGAYKEATTWSAHISEAMDTAVRVVILCHSLESSTPYMSMLCARCQLHIGVLPYCAGFMRSYVRSASHIVSMLVCIALLSLDLLGPGSLADG